MWSLSSYLEIRSTPNNAIIQSCCFLTHTYSQRRECLLSLSKGDVQNADTRGQGCIQIYWGGHKTLGTAPGRRRNTGLTLSHQPWHTRTPRCPSPTAVPPHHCQRNSIFRSPIVSSTPVCTCTQIRVCRCVQPLAHGVLCVYCHTEQHGSHRKLRWRRLILWRSHSELWMWPKVGCTTLIWPLNTVLDIL